MRLNEIAVIGIVLSTLLLFGAILVEIETGYPSRCSIEQLFYGENEWVKTHYCGYWPNQPPRN